MKKIILLAAAAVLSASFTGISAADKNNDKAAKQAAKKMEQTRKDVEKTIPLVLVNASDTLSYTAGMTMTTGLDKYIEQAFGVKKEQMGAFVSGMLEYYKGMDDSERQAYLTGIAIASQLKSQMLPGIKKEFTDTPDSIVTKNIFRGFVDALLSDTTRFNMEDAEEEFNALREKNKTAKEEALYGENRKKGEAFLAENAKKEGVVTTASGLQYKVITMGTGEKPKATSKVKVHYKGTLIDGTVFDESRKHGTEPLSFYANQVISGWTEALTLMPVGSTWELYIPQNLGYGSRNAGTIPPYSTLIFTVELIGIE